MKKVPMLDADCVECSASIWNAWRQKGLNIRHQARRHDFPDTKRRMLEALVDLTYGLGLEEVMIPNLKYFCSVTGLEKPHVSDAIAWLHLNRVIRVRTDKGQPHYTIRDPEDWKVSQRELMLDAEERIEQIRAFNGLEPKGKPDFFESKARPGQKTTTVTECVKQEVKSEESLPDLD